MLTIQAEGPITWSVSTWAEFQSGLKFQLGLIYPGWNYSPGWARQVIASARTEIIVKTAFSNCAFAFYFFQFVFKTQHAASLTQLQ